MITLAIDPGPERSAYCWVDPDTLRPISVGIDPNSALRHILRNELDLDDRLIIEMIASYGMPVGLEVFQTCLWVGRFVEAAFDDVTAELVPRLAVKTHLCHSAKATDANVTQALVDRFAPGQPNHGKGTKANPGFFAGFRADIWQSFALAVYAIDTNQQRET